jgi:phosphate starvation-inducible protein PhoH
MGKGTKIIVTGDMAQCDLPNKKDSGFDFFKRLETAGMPKFKIIELQSNHRHDLVEFISRVYDEIRS